MKKMAAFISLEVGRLVRKRNLVLFLLLLSLLILSLNSGINRYNLNFERIESFRGLETVNFQKLKNIYEYRYQGIAVAFQPEAMTIFFTNLGLPPDLTGKVDAYTYLGIHDNFKDNSLFTGTLTGLWNCAGVLLLFGSLLVLFLGFETFRDKEYLKCLASLLSGRRVFFYTVLARVLLISLALIFLFAGMVLFALGRGIDISLLSVKGMGGFFLASWLVMVFFFLLGTILGLTLKNHNGLIALLVAWFALVFLANGFVGSLVESKALDCTEDYRNEIDKSEVYINFEKQAKKSMSKADLENTDVKKLFVKKYLNEDYKAIERLETTLRRKIAANIENYEVFSGFVPTVFYQATATEAGSKGLRNFTAFYAYLQKTKLAFIQFFLNRLYYNNPGVMVNFIQGEENIFRARSRLPGKIGLGVLVNLVYILVLMGLSMVFFQAFIYTSGLKKSLKNQNPAIRLDKNHYFVSLLLRKGQRRFNDHLYNLLSGKLDRFNRDIDITVDGIDPREHPGKRDFVYLCHPDRIPAEITAAAYIRFFSILLNIGKTGREKIFASIPKEAWRKSLAELEDIDKGRVYLSVWPYLEKKIFLLDDVYLDLPAEFLFELRDIILGWLAEEAAVILMSSHFIFDANSYRQEKTSDVGLYTEWLHIINQLKRAIESEKDNVS